MIGEVADLFLREEKTDWTMCTGFFDGKLLISIRTSQEKNRADKAVKFIVARKGTGGGHLTYAGGQIPLRNDSESGRHKLKHSVESKFLQALNISEKRCTELVSG
jgi:hypothetical protein